MLGKAKDLRLPIVGQIADSPDWNVRLGSEAY